MQTQTKIIFFLLFICLSSFASEQTTTGPANANESKKKLIDRSYISFGQSSLKAWTVESNFATDDEGLFPVEGTFNRLEYSADIADNYSVKLGADFDELGDTDRRLLVNFGGKSIGLIFEKGTLPGEVRGPMWNGSSFSNQKKNYDGDYKMISLYWRKSLDDYFNIGITYTKFSIPTSLTYKTTSGTGLSSYINTIDEKFEYEWLGVLLLKDPVKKVMRTVANGGHVPTHDWYFYNMTIMGIVYGRISSEYENALDSAYSSVGINDKSWGGWGVIGHYELGYQLFLNVFGNPLILHAGFMLRAHSPLFFKELFDSKLLDEYDKGDVSVPNDYLWLYGPSVKLSYSF